MSKQEKMFSEFNQPTDATESVEKYEFEPIQGYPMLHWKGKRPFRSTQYYPAQLKETYGEPVDGWVNRIYWGDNLQVMSHLLKEFRGRVDLVYIDPPFDSKAVYKKKVKIKTKQISNDQSAFEEKQYADIWTNDDYLQFIYERLILIKELLKDTGTIYLHCDYHKSHNLRCIMDEVFGDGGENAKSSGFKNEIIWKRTNAHGDSATFGNIHDSLLFYSKSTEYTYNELLTDYEEWYIERYYRYKDPDGRKFLSRSLSASGLSGGGYNYVWKGIDGFWRCPEKTMEDLDSQNKIFYTKNGIPRYKQYLDEMQGRPLQSLWDDIQPVGSWFEENVSYPTQKPMTLIERIIKASSNQGDLVFDCFMGSGTTQAVAMKLGRRFIGADINLGAIQITTKRLLDISSERETLQSEGEYEVHYTSFSVYNVNHYDVFRNPAQAKDLLIEALEIQPLQFSTMYDGEKDGRMVKIMPINRIATRADLNDLISNFDYKTFEKRKAEQPTKPVERLLLVCMGHEPDLAGVLEKEAGYKLDIEVVDILRDKSSLEFKRDSEAYVAIDNGNLAVHSFYPMSLLQKMSLMKEDVKDWRELVESIMIDWDYDGETLRPTITDIPGKKELVKGQYPLPEQYGNIRVKITDMLSESWEGGVQNG